MTTQCPTLAAPSPTWFLFLRLRKQQHGRGTGELVLLLQDAIFTTWQESCFHKISTIWFWERPRQWHQLTCQHNQEKLTRTTLEEDLQELNGCCESLIKLFLNFIILTVLMIRKKQNYQVRILFTVICITCIFHKRRWKHKKSLRWEMALCVKIKIASEWKWMRIMVGD